MDALVVTVVVDAAPIVVFTARPPAIVWHRYRVPTRWYGIRDGERISDVVGLTTPQVQGQSRKLSHFFESVRGRWELRAADIQTMRTTNNYQGSNYGFRPSVLRYRGGTSLLDPLAGIAGLLFIHWRLSISCHFRRARSQARCKLVYLLQGGGFPVLILLRCGVGQCILILLNARGCCGSNDRDGHRSPYNKDDLENDFVKR